MKDMDFSHSSQKSWDLLRKMGAAQPTWKENAITANAPESNFFKTSNIKLTKQRNFMINRIYKKELENYKEKSTLINDFIEEEVDHALKNVEKRKSGRCLRNTTGIYKNLGSRNRLCFAHFFTSVSYKETVLKHGEKRKFWPF